MLHANLVSDLLLGTCSEPWTATAAPLQLTNSLSSPPKKWSGVNESEQFVGKDCCYFTSLQP